jgi:hypothetical protein
VSVATDEDLERIDARLREWRQGDVVRGPGLFFLHAADLACPLTAEAAEAAAGEPGNPTGLAEIVSTADHGLVVLTQTCDLVRPCGQQPFVELAPLIHIPSENDFRMVQLGMRPRYAVVPAVQGERLVAELDRTMTLEKAALAGWPRTSGCATDAERRAFAEALARKRSRPAFPDDFAAGMGRFQERLRDKHGKGSPEGLALRALGEIRVRAAPSWDAERVTLTFWFIKTDDDPIEPDAWERQIEAWLGLLGLPERFSLDDPAYRLRRLEDVNARQYRESDRLDLDHLSGR